jgi:hypothetical protein
MRVHLQGQGERRFHTGMPSGCLNPSDTISSPQWNPDGRGHRLLDQKIHHDFFWKKRAEVLYNFGTSIVGVLVAVCGALALADKLNACSVTSILVWMSLSLVTGVTLTAAAT